MDFSSLSQEQAIEILNKWGDTGFFRLNKFGNLIKIEQITPYVCVVSGVQTQYENRDIRIESTPYSGGSIDSGIPPGTWEIEVPRPKEFEKSKKDFIVPRSERVETCSGCSGSGEKTCGGCWGNGKVNCSFCLGNGESNCSNCWGSGKANCSSCGGQGYRTDYRSRSESYYDYSTNSTQYRTVYENVRENCYSCSYGKVTCSNCSGRGKKTCTTCFGQGKVTCLGCGGRGVVTCGTCDGYGKVKFYKVLTVKFEHKEYKTAINHSDIPDKKLFKTSGEIIVDELKPKIEEAKLLLKDNNRLPKEFVQVTDFSKVSYNDCPSCGLALSVPNQEDVRATCQDPWHTEHSNESQSLISMVSLKDEVVASVEGLLVKAEEKEGLILFQRLFIQGINTYKIEYTRNNSPTKIIWIYGKEEKVFSVGTPPLDWRRVGAASVLAAIMLVLLVAFIASSSPPATYQPQPQDTQSKSVELTAVVPRGAIVRQGAGAEFRKVAELKKGQTVTLLSDVQTAKNGGVWEKIRVDEVEGYVNQKLLTKNENSNSASLAQASPVLNETENVMQAVRELWEAARLQDEKRLQDILDDDYISLGKNKEAYIKSLLAPDLKFKSIDVDYKNAKVQLNGEKATVTYKAKYAITRNSETWLIDNRSIDTFINSGGKWRAYRGLVKQRRTKEAVQNDVKKLGNSLRPGNSLEEAKRKEAPANKAKTASDKPIPVNGNVEMIGRDGVEAPKILYKERPRYTEEARINKTEGVVTLSVVFTVDGHIADIKVIRGLPDGLTDTAIEAAKRIRFQPATKGGQPVSARGSVQFTFSAN